MTSQALNKVRLRSAPPVIAADAIVKRIKAGLARVYGNRLVAVVLYGSRARGDARPDSDYDIIAFVKGYDRRKDWNPDLHRLTDELFQQGPPEVEVNIISKDEKALLDETIFMHNVRSEGVLL